MASPASPSPVDVSPRIAEKRARRRAEVVHAALQAFREHGYHQTTLDDIASRLGIRPSALYHYFPDKETLLYHCHREASREVERLLAAAEARCDQPLEQLRHVIREHVRVMTETLEGSPLAFEVTALAPERQVEIVAARDRYERGIRQIIARGIEQGTFRPVDPKLATFAILGAINWIARWYRPGGPLGTLELGRDFADYLVGGLTCQ